MLNSVFQVRLEVISQLFKTMFNPDQKLAIYMSVREALNVPPHEFRVNVLSRYFYIINTLFLMILMFVFIFRRFNIFTQYYHQKQLY